MKIRVEKQKIIRITTVPESMRILLKGQLGFMSNHYDVVAVSSGGDSFEPMLAQEGIRGVKVNMTRKITPFKDFISLFKLIILFYKEKPYIVHTHTPKAGTLGMIAAYICRVPHRLHTIAGLPLLEAQGKKRKLLEFVEKITYFCATKVYPNSLEMQKIILENGYAKVNKLNVIGKGSSNGIDTNYFDPAIVQAYESDFTKHKFLFCFVGRIVGDKGVNELIVAFTRLQKEYSDIGLLMVGDFEKELDRISSESEKQILENSGIKFLGFQSDVRPFMKISDVLVFPSYREGFPNVVMQSGAMGLPAIVTNINGCNEIIENGINGIIIPPKEVEQLYTAMKNVYENRALLDSLSSQARRMIVSRYQREYVWDCLLNEYKSLPHV